MSERERNLRVVRSSLAVLLRIAVLFALAILFLLPAQGTVVSGRSQLTPARPSQANLNQTIHNTSAVKAVAPRTPALLF